MLELFEAEASGRAVKRVAAQGLAHNLFLEKEHSAPRAMNTATVNEMDRIAYLGKLMALIQLYLELNLPVTDAILAAECDLVTWKILDPDFHQSAHQRRLNGDDQLSLAERLA